MIQRFIYVTLQQEFIHQYKDAPEEVSYLRYPHRHLAHIKVQIEVYHNERELEFIMVKHKISAMLQDYLRVTCGHSCETIAEFIINFVQEEYGNNRDIIVDVSEDGENGCQLIYQKEE